MNHYYIEMTDTFGGEANYCWVNRFIVSANTTRGAMRKVTNRTGDKVFCAMSGDSERWDSRSACICYFVEWVDGDRIAELRANYFEIEVVK